MFLLLLAVLLFPIAVYCSILGMINRRPRPLVVSGSWDFVGVLLATSGFLLFVGPALLSGAFRQSLRDLPLQRDSGSLGSAILEIWAAWWVLWLLYYLFVIGGAAFLVWSRRETTVIYGVDSKILDWSLSRAAESLGLALERRGNRIYLGKSMADTLQIGEQLGGCPSPLTEVPQPSAHESLVIDLEPFPLLTNVCLHWTEATPAARADLERVLRNSLLEAPVADSATGSWLMSIGATLFIIVMLLTGAFIFLVVTLMRR